MGSVLETYPSTVMITHFNSLTLCSVYLSACLSLSLCLDPALQSHSIPQYLNLPVGLPVCLTLSIPLYSTLPFSPSLSLNLLVCLSVYILLSIALSPILSICLSVYMPLSLSISFSLSLPISLAFFSFIHLYLSLPYIKRSKLLINHLWQNFLGSY